MSDARKARVRQFRISRRDRQKIRTANRRLAQRNALASLER